MLKMTKNKQGGSLHGMPRLGLRPLNPPPPPPPPNLSTQSLIPERKHKFAHDSYGCATIDWRLCFDIHGAPQPSSPRFSLSFWNGASDTDFKAPLVLPCYDLGNKVSHDMGTFKVIDQLARRIVPLFGTVGTSLYFSPSKCYNVSENLHTKLFNLIFQK